MMKAINRKTLLKWWGKLLRKEEMKSVVNNEEKPVQSTTKGAVYRLRRACALRGNELI